MEVIRSEKSLKLSLLEYVDSYIYKLKPHLNKRKFGISRT